jgi:hypothetical protein
MENVENSFREWLPENATSIGLSGQKGKKDLRKNNHGLIR